MKRRLLTLLGTLLLGACADPTTIPQMEPAFAKPGGGPTDKPAGVTLGSTGIVTAGDNLGEYRNGVCGVTATVFYAGSNDLIMNTTYPSAGDKKCSGKPAGSYPRKINVTVNGATYSANGVNVLDMGSVAIGTTAARQVGIPLASGPCVRIQFNLADGGIPVTRNTSSTYTIAGSGEARCVQSDGSFSSMGIQTVSFSAASY